MEASESKDSFTLFTEMKVDFSEFIRPFFSFNFVFTFNDNLSAVAPYFFRRTFHVDAIVTIRCFLLYDSESEFVWRIEGHDSFLVFFIDRNNIFTASYINIFDLLIESDHACFGSISKDWTLHVIDLI